MDIYYFEYVIVIALYAYNLSKGRIDIDCDVHTRIYN